ncbi:MAG: alpha/beta fold hydrolase [Opitutales bacterium]
MGEAQAPALVILHGLLGASRNWGTIGRALGDCFDVHLLDLRNHGESPHAESMRWSDLCADLQAYLQEAKKDRIILVGHSLGGKIAMRFACKFPDLVQKLVVVDIAAKAYPPYHDAEFRAMRSIAVGQLENRKEAEAALEPLVPDWAMRQFLLTNLVRDRATGAFAWQANIEALHGSLPHIRMNSLSEADRYEGPTLLVRAERSEFIGNEDAEAMRHWFPKLIEMTVPEAGHNVHVENRPVFLKVLQAWLDSTPPSGADLIAQNT